MALDREMRRLPGLTNDLFRLGEVERLKGRFSRALEAFKEAASLSRASDNRVRLAESLECKAECWARLGRQDLAADLIKEAAATSRPPRRRCAG